MAGGGRDRGSDEILGFDRRKALVALAIAVILAAGVFGLIGRIADFGELKRAVERADRRWFPLAALGEVLAYATAYLLTALPLPAGGAGSMEAVTALTLHAVGVPLAPALLAAFVYRIFAFWLPILPALALVPSIARLGDELPRAGRD